MKSLKRIMAMILCTGLITHAAFGQTSWRDYLSWNYLKNTKFIVALALGATALGFAINKFFFSGKSKPSSSTSVDDMVARLKKGTILPQPKNAGPKYTDSELTTFQRRLIKRILDAYTTYSQKKQNINFEEISESNVNNKLEIQIVKSAWTGKPVLIFTYVGIKPPSDFKELAPFKEVKITLATKHKNELWYTLESEKEFKDILTWLIPPGI